MKNEMKNEMKNKELENLAVADLDDRKKAMLQHPKSRHGSSDVYIASLKQEIKIKKDELKKYAIRVKNLERKCTRLCGLLGQHGIDVDIEHL